jgi:hypothetical protein
MKIVVVVLLHQLLLMHVESLLLIRREVKSILVHNSINLGPMTAEPGMLAILLISCATNSSTSDSAPSSTNGAEISLLMWWHMEANFPESIDGR